MKKIFIILLLILFPLLSGCSTFGEKILITRTNITESYDSSVDYSKKDLKDYTFNVSSQNVHDMIINQESFVLLLGSESCSQCIVMKPLLIRYILTSKAAIHYLDLDNETDYLIYTTKLVGLKDKNENDIFTISGTPIFYFFDKGIIRDELPKLKSYDAYRNLEAIFKARIEVTNITLIRDYTELLATNRDDAIILFYVIDDKIGQSVYQDMIISKGYQLYIFHASFVDLPLDLLLPFHLASIIKTTLTKYDDYSLADEIVFSAMSVTQNMLDSFFAY